jgi:DNA invertase Pin-like site-specific DNA recombinase
MNTVIYARYSAGPRQTDQSIEGQLRVCTDFCKQRGLTVIDTYCDRHISGRTDERPEFQRLIADAKRKKFEAVVVYKTDRFARNKYDSAVYKRELKRNGIQIFYAAEAIPDGPEGIILESLMEGLAEYYSAELAQKIKRGMHESALKCQSTGSGRPLGYRVDEQKRFQIDPESAQTVQTIFEQYIKGESNAAICELLNSRGLRTAQGKPFNKNSINRIIKNRKYIGEYRYHDIVVEGGMPAIISKDTFNLAQAEMERRRTRKAPKSPKAEYILAGRLFCGHCKGPMQGVSGTGKSGNKWYYYYCGNTRGKNKTCDKKQVSRDRLERAVVDFTVRYILQEEVLEELARKVHAAQERQNDTASEIAFYEKKLADNKKSIANVLRAIESGAATQTLPARLQELENEQAVILGELNFLKGKRLAFTEDQILFALMKHLEPYPGESEQDYRRRIISDFVSEVYLYDDRLLIYFNISSEDGKLKSADLSNIEGGEFDGGLISSTMKKERHFVRNWRSFLYHGNVFGNTIEFSGCSHQRIIQHFNELYRAGRTGQRIACQLLHILRVCEPCTFSCPADSALNRFWLTSSAVGDRGIDIFLHGLQAVFLLTDQLKTLAQDTVGAQIACDAHRAQQIIDLSGQFGNDHS